MSENLNRDFSKYEAMETEELEEILRSDAEAPEGAESDTELLLYILEVLASRRNTKSITGNTAQKAWESFEQNYMPKEPQKSVKNRKPSSWIRRLAAVAAVAALVIIIPISSNALTLDEIWDIFARWAKETFSFVSSDHAEVSEPSPNDTDSYSSLQEVMKEDNHDITILPTWIPPGFSLEKIEKDISPVQEIYFARYTNGDKVLKIRVQNHLNSDALFIETNQEYTEVYPLGELLCYIFINYNQTQAVWVLDSYECTISGNISIDEIKLMIDSIEKG